MNEGFQRNIVEFAGWRRGGIPTADTLKEDYLFGLSLTDGNGNIYPDKAIERWLEKACAWLEYELDVTLKATVISEDHDYHADEYQQFCYINLYRFPVLSVDSLYASYGGMKIMDFPSDWYRVYPESGQLQLVPTVGSLSALLLQQGGDLLLPLITGALSQMPHLFQVSYTIGFGNLVNDDVAAQGGSVTSVVLGESASSVDNAYKGMRIVFWNGGTVWTAGDPVYPASVDILAYDGATKTATLSMDTPLAAVPDGSKYRIYAGGLDESLRDMIATKASIDILRVLGDVLYAPGVASQSFSLDGISQSFSVTRSADGGAYSGRIKQYLQKINDDLPLLKKRYQGFRLNVA